jgi:hypothetical protein
VKLSKKGEGWVVDFAVAGWTRPAQVSIITHLGKMLDKVKGKDVTIAKVGGRYDVQVIVPEEKLGDPGVVASFEALRKEIAAKAFAGSPVTLDLCDAQAESKKTLGP